VHDYEITYSGYFLHHSIIRTRTAMSLIYMLMPIIRLVVLKNIIPTLKVHAGSRPKSPGRSLGL